MGSDQSRQADPNGSAQGPTDYYELLQVSEEATSEEIKRSYRRLALLTHPDKVPPEKVEEATKLFADMQQAYEILMDPNERAFYDTHRNLPPGATDEELFDHVRNNNKTKPRFAGPGKPGVRLEQLLRFFDPKLARKTDDSKEGFFSTYRTLFALLASDEADHTPEPLEFPSFGDSQSGYAPREDMTRSEKASQPWIRDFYTAWREFSTAKRFDWVQKWDAERGGDRSMRRLMEKENKKLRDEYRRDYNNTIRQLAAFIQTRDPRYKAYRAQTRRKNAKSSGAGTPAEPSAGPSPEDIRRQAAEEFEEQDWQRIEELHLSSSEDDGQEMYECVACGKTFASEPSWVNHEKSKRHKQAVYNLERQMRREAEELGFDLSEEAIVDLDGPANPVTRETVDVKSDVPDEEDTPTVSMDANGLDLDNTQVGDYVISPSDPVLPPPAEGNGDSLDLPDTRPAPEPATSTSKRAGSGPKRSKGKKQASVDSGTSTQPLDGRVDAPRPQKTKASKTKAPSVSPEAIEQKFQHVINEIESKRIKLGEKWGDKWQASLATLRIQLGSNPHLLCLGLGKPYSDRTAQIQMALLLRLIQDFEIPFAKVTAFDPVWDDLDKRVLTHFEIPLVEQNLVGKHVLDDDQCYLLYLPHCPKTLYQNILRANFRPRLCQPGRLLLGNDLEEYVGDTPARLEDEAFVKPKKKRAGRNRSERPRRDGVLERIVEHLDALSLSSLPDTHLPGFARAFLSLSFQWLGSDKVETIDWSALPESEAADDPEIVVVP